MRIIKAEYKGKIFYAAWYEDEIRPLMADQGLEEAIPKGEIKLHNLAEPTKIVCVGLNYHAHAREMDMEIPEEPLLFLKPPSAVIGDGEDIIYPTQSSNVHFEGELAIVIGKICKDQETSEISKYIWGYTCANDVTARDLQAKDVQYTRAKGFDTFCPIGPCLETDFEQLKDQAIWTRVNGQTRQEGRTSDMIVPPWRVVSYISKIMTLMPGDVILTGTPPGVGSLDPGDEVEVEIEGIGILKNKVKLE